MAVDDEPAVLDVLKTMLESHGCEVVPVVDSREAVERLKIEKVDGLFLDVQMPHLDGFEVTKLARETRLNRQVPIVMLTASDDAETMRRGFQLGITFFLGKPFSRERVYNLLRATRGPLTREQHRYIRLPYRTAVNCVWGPEGQRHFRSESQNISEGGMLLSPTGGMELGQDLETTFPIPGTAHPLKVKARVVRPAPPYGLGLMFRELKERDKEALQQYIRDSIKD
jgi:CheY-like chemotaxis protein